VAEGWSKAFAKEALDTWTRLFGFRIPTVVGPGMELFRKGSFASDIHLVVDGLVTLTGDAEQTVAIRVPGQLIEHCSHNLGVPYRVSATAITETRILQVSVKELELRKREDPAVAIFFERILSMDLWHAATCITELKTAHPSRRLQRFLRFIGAATDSSRIRWGYEEVKVPLSDEQMASILGLSVRQFKRVKKQMQNAGVLKIPKPKIWACQIATLQDQDPQFSH
jgi:CRP-like cAMP-binding protein